MSDDKPGVRPADETQPVRPGEPAAGPGGSLPSPPAAPGGAASAEPAATATGRRGFRERLRTWRGSEGDRTFGLAALIASALAGIIVGGLGFATVHAVADDRDDRGGTIERRHTEGDRFGGRR